MGFGTNYSGNALAAEAPDSAPQPGVPPLFYLPSNLDGFDWGNAYQALRRGADELAYMKSSLWIRHQELWLLQSGASYSASATPIPSFGQLSVVGTGTFALNALGPGVGVMPFYGNGVQLQQLAATSSCVVSTSARLVPFAAAGAGPPTGPQGCIFDLQGWILAPTGITATGNVFVGFSSADTWTTAIPTASIGLYWAPGASAWTLFNAGTNSAALSNTYNPAATALWQRYRIAWYGAATPQGIANSNTAYAALWLSQPGQSAFASASPLVTVNGTPAVGSGNHQIVHGSYSGTAAAMLTDVGPYVFQINPQAWGT